MSVSVSMPQLGESVTEGTVTRWLKREGEHVQADEPLLEVSTDKVDTEIPSPVSGILRGITVAEDETVAVGAELAIIEEDGSAGAAPQTAAPQAAAPPQAPAEAAAAPPAAEPPQAPPPAYQEPAAAYERPAATYEPPAASYEPPAASYEPPAASYEPPAASYEPPAASYEPPLPSYEPPAQAEVLPADPPPTEAPVAPPSPATEQAPPAYQSVAAAYPAATDYDAGNGQASATPQFTDGTDGPYVTPLVRKLAAEHGIDLATVTGTGVGGRIRKQDILDAATLQRGPVSPAPQPGVPQPGPRAAAVQQAPGQQPPGQQPPGQQAPTQAAPAQSAPTQSALTQSAPAQSAPAQPAARPTPRQAAADTQPEGGRRPAIVPSSLRGTTERMSRARQVIAQRMVESLQTSAQLTTVVEADVTAIARLRNRAKPAFEAREGVKLSFLPFFALAAVEALKVHPKLNAVIDTASSQVTYHDAEHLGIAVDTERGLMVPVIKNAGDLNIGGLARKIADLAQRTRAGQVNPDDLSGGTFTLTNTGSRGALFDTPIINQPQVGILGTGTVVKRAVVVEDPTLGEVITVRSMVYLALTYDHRLVDGADAARFLVTIKERLEEGAFETELGL
jgi:pyruvate dehydrogenase E2 component (dihydrolipoamide acetyltransferase)